MLSHDLLQKQEIFCNMVTELQANLFSTRKLAGSKEKKKLHEVWSATFLQNESIHISWLEIVSSVCLIHNAQIQKCEGPSKEDGWQYPHH